MNLTSKLKALFLTGILIMTSQSVSAQTINWGGTSFSFNNLSYLSDGSAMPATFNWQVGTFTGGFVPTLSNASSWSSNWVSFGSDTTDPSFPYTWGGIGSVSSAATNGLQGYIWGYNNVSLMGQTGGEALLVTSASWVTPTFGSITPSPDWAIGNATTAVVGRIDTNINGAGGVIQGAGTYTSPVSDSTASTFEVQSASFGTSPVPEPSAALLLGVVGMMARLRRLRRVSAD